MTEQPPADPYMPPAWWWPSEGFYLIPRGGGVYDVLLPFGDGWETDCTPLHELPADAVELRPQPAAAAVPDTGHSPVELKPLIVGYSCTRCGGEMRGNRRECPRCGYTVFSPIWSSEKPEWDKRVAAGAVPDTGHQPAADLPARLRFAYSEAAHLGWHGVAATLLDLAGQLEPGDDDDSDEVCAAIARALASASPSGDTEKPCVRCSSRGAPVCCCVDGPVPATGHPTAPPADLPFVPDEMWLTAEWGVIESDGSGAWRTIENGLYVETLPAVRIRLVPEVDAAASPSGDTGQESRQ